MKTKKVAKNILKRDHTFYSDFTNNQGKRIRRSLGKDLVQAKIKVLQLKADIAIQQTPKDEPLPTSGKNYKSAVNEFINSVYSIENSWDRKHWNQNGERQPQLVLTTLKRFQEYSGISNVSQARLPQMMRFMDDRRKLVRATTLRKNIQFLQKFFSWCESMDYVVKSYARGLRKPKAETPQRYAFQPSEVQLILENAGDFKDYFILALATGLRPCDTKGLTQDDFDIKDDYMRLKIISEKTKKPVYIPVSKLARSVVERLGHRLFPNADEEMWQKALRRNLTRMFDSSYVRKHNIRLHTLRHTFAVNKLNAGVPKEAIQNFLGHASVKTTEIYCNQMSDETLVQWVEVGEITA